MITPAQRAEIRRLNSGEHWKLGTIAAELGLHHETVRAAVECEAKGVRRGVCRPSALDLSAAAHRQGRRAGRRGGAPWLGRWRDVALVFHRPLRCSDVAALRWTDVALSAGDDIVAVTVRGSKMNPVADGGDVRQLAGGCSAALRRPTRRRSRREVVGHRTRGEPNQPPVRGRMRGRRPRKRRTPHSGRVGLAVELGGARASTRDGQRAGGWKTRSWLRATRPASALATAR